MEHNRILVIGGGPAGLEAARGAAELGQRALLIEKAPVLGGSPILAPYAALTPDMEDAETAMQRMIDAVENDDLVDIRTGTSVVAAEGEPPDLTVTLENGDGREKVSVGAVIVCTGLHAEGTPDRAALDRRTPQTGLLCSVRRQSRPADRQLLVLEGLLRHRLQRSDRDP
jgi:heterodisulfide reductase subunit A-like polyferredoxin